MLKRLLDGIFPRPVPTDGLGTLGERRLLDVVFQRLGIGIIAAPLLGIPFTMGIGHGFYSGAA